MSFETDRETTVFTRGQAVIDQGLRQYMLKIYNYMTIGLLITAGVGYYLAHSPYFSMFFTPEGQLTGMGWIALLLPLPLVFMIYPAVRSLNTGLAFGLFALYSLYRCDVFSRAASISGSLWFPGFLEYAETQEMERRPDRLYLSLGDREDRSRNPILRTVREHTEQLASHLEQKGLRVTWELNPGNHFMEPELRTAKGIRALLEA